MNANQKNQQLVETIKEHLTLVQSGKCGQPTLPDLEFCGILHSVLPELVQKSNAKNVKLKIVL